MRPAVKKSLKFALRWGIAIAGVWFVVKNISLYDTVRVTDPADGRPVTVRLATPAEADPATYTVYKPDDSGATQEVSRDQLIARCEYDRLKIHTTNQPEPELVDVLGLIVPADKSVPRRQWPLLVSQPRTIIQKFLDTFPPGKAWAATPQQVVGTYNVDLSYPLVDMGLINVVKKADHSLLWVALAIFPLNYLITSYRWKLLLWALEIPLTLGRAFQINMVGAFYNTFMPGSTGGDLVKAYYAAKHTTHRTRAVMSVVVDRVIGLLALVILGGTVAATKALTSQDVIHDPVARKCMQVAIGSAVVLALVTVGLCVYYIPLLRRMTGLDFLLRKLPMQKHVQHAIETMDLYGKRPGLMLSILLMSIPVHAVTVLSATAAGFAFGLPLKAGYYWVVVPVVTLAGALPVSPQGAGVMEFFAYLLMRGQKATVADALVLTMSIRFVQIFWNLIAGLVVLRGGYHAPTEKEAKELEEDEVPENRSAPTSS